MADRVPGWPALALLCAYPNLGCGDNSASDGSTSQGTAETGAEEGGADSAGDPGPDGPGCDEAWEGWWNDASDDAKPFSEAFSTPEATPQRGRWHAHKAINTPTSGPASPATDDDSLRATLISEAAVLSTGRNLAVSWCLGNIFPTGALDEEHDATNLERYLLFREELERALRVWERHSRMNFVHLAPLDDRLSPSGGMCDTALEHVWFRAQTGGCNPTYQGLTNAGGETEFDPDAGSSQNPEGYDRVLCIAWQFLAAAKARIPYYAGHESGHILGLDHEHLRWSQGEEPHPNCGANDPFDPVSPERILTAPDPWSVMGYDECVGSEDSDGISPRDMLGAYYTFNWAERRVRDMAPQTGGRDRRLWAGDDRPGVLWYLPFPDRLLEWRFDAQQPGSLAFESVERCLGGAPPCALSDSGGHWHPVVGQFAGGSDALDVFMYSPDGAADVLLRNRSHEGTQGFERVEAPAPERAIPVAGNFAYEGTRDQLLWYRPGPAGEQLWAFDESGGHQTLDADVDQDEFRIPITGHFRSRTHATDIIWFEPRSATTDTWIFNPELSVLKSGPSSVELLGVIEGTEYLPIVGNFDGDNRTDLFWYAPGSSADWLWLSDSNQVVINFDSYEFAVDGEYHPVVGDFDGDADDDILWYRPAAELAGGSSWLWYFDGPSVEAHPFEVVGDYVPYAEDLDGDGCTDILWYDPVAPGNPSPVWRCVPEDRTFSCGEQLPTPKGAYPIGVSAGGY
ncbi:FG-GAP repeat protein [Enhygromyxa salina]|uniref:FG-GAP repeat protein n=1 Tax=Enhygromyxa salina TaxID=215803 RepID=A0A2S9XME4_9BACT|nr:hypothetical protein [Enhygromyxa salina]PRP94046.1 FG-GAP repeat protein [Enhygromyxa salina]